MCKYAKYAKYVKYAKYAKYAKYFLLHQQCVPPPNIFLIFRSSFHKSKCHEVQSPLSPFTLAEFGLVELPKH